MAIVSDNFFKIQNSDCPVISEDGNFRVDNSGRSTYKSCKRKFYWQNIHGVQSNYGSTALRYGSCWHALQEGYHQWIVENGWPQSTVDTEAAITQGLHLANKTYLDDSKSKEFYDDFKNFNTAVQAFDAYLNFFIDDLKYLTIVYTEKKFECPIEPQSQFEHNILAGLPPLIFTGKIDLCIQMDHMNWIFDFKTTGWYLDKVIQQANRSPQLIGYSYAGDKVLDFKPHGCLCSFHYLGSTKSRKTGLYGKVRFDFRRVPQIFTADDIAAWKFSFIETAREMYRSIEEDLWPESFDNCFQYGACPYLKLCRQHLNYEDPKLNLDGFHIHFWNVLEE